MMLSLTIAGLIQAAGWHFTLPYDQWVMEMVPYLLLYRVCGFLLHYSQNHGPQNLQSLFGHLALLAKMRATPNHNNDGPNDHTMSYQGGSTPRSMPKL
jgi:hypothetical protein